MILVTGGAGFIGSAIVAGLNERGIDDILVVDILGKDGKWKNLRNLQYADYMEAAEFYPRLTPTTNDFRFEAVFHLGACSSTTESDCSYLVGNNFECSRRLALFAAQRGMRFIYASSAATYGDGSRGFSDDEGAMEKLRPLNMYGYSKQMFDVWAKRNHLLDHIVGLKYFNVFGPNEYHKGEMRSFILKAFEQIREKGRVGLFKSYRKEYADGGQRRDFLYVKDAVAMTLFFFDNQDTYGIFNIGTGKARSWNDLAAAIFAVMELPAAIEYIPMPDILRDKYQYYTCAEMTKLREAGYTNPTTPMEGAVKEYVQTYLVNEQYLG
jgi:ADP-L-glycero-D-manno-heptose 6-epimerase